MGKSKSKYKRSSHSKKTSFNSNLYENSKPEMETASVMGNKMAGWIYRICAVLFAAGVFINYSSGDGQQTLMYLLLLCVDVYLIYINHKKSKK